MGGCSRVVVVVVVEWHGGLVPFNETGHVQFVCICLVCSIYGPDNLALPISHERLSLKSCLLPYLSMLTAEHTITRLLPYYGCHKRTNELLHKQNGRLLWLLTRQRSKRHEERLRAPVQTMGSIQKGAATEMNLLSLLVERRARGNKLGM